MVQSEMGLTESPRRRLDYLDGLRGIAALFVVFHHFFLAYLAGQDARAGLVLDFVAKSPLKVMINGRFCVFTFFVLSGFVLAESVANGKSLLPARLVARYMRLTVPMVVSLIFAWLLLQMLPVASLQSIELSSHQWIQTYLAGVSTKPGVLQVLKDGFYGVYLSGDSHFNPVVWTMRKELIGSVAIYFVYRFSPKQYR